MPVLIYSKQKGKQLMSKLFSNEINGFKKGAKVRYIRGKTAFIGLNQVYTLENVEVYGYSTDLYLVERPGLVFNVVDFELVE
jgi:hypothetical protein